MRLVSESAKTSIRIDVIWCLCCRSFGCFQRSATMGVEHTRVTIVCTGCKKDAVIDWDGLYGIASNYPEVS